MAYTMDMNGEDKVMFELPDGWHDFEIVELKETTFKSGNQGFIAKVVSCEDAGLGTDVYLVAEKGKRWFLKQLLKACGLEADEEGNFNWDIPDVEGHTVQGRVEHEQQDEWIDRNGKTQPGKLKAKIVEFKKLEA